MLCTVSGTSIATWLRVINMQICSTMKVPMIQWNSSSVQWRYADYSMECVHKTGAHTETLHCFCCRHIYPHKDPAMNIQLALSTVQVAIFQRLIKTSPDPANWTQMIPCPLDSKDSLEWFSGTMKVPYRLRMFTQDIVRKPTLRRLSSTVWAANSGNHQIVWLISISFWWFLVLDIKGDCQETYFTRAQLGGIYCQGLSGNLYLELWDNVMYEYIFREYPKDF